jgi:hypothetical protein
MIIPTPPMVVLCDRTPGRCRTSIRTSWLFDSAVNALFPCGHEKRPVLHLSTFVKTRPTRDCRDSMKHTKTPSLSYPLLLMLPGQAPPGVASTVREDKFWTEASPGKQALPLVWRPDSVQMLRLEHPTFGSNESEQDRGTLLHPMMIETHMSAPRDPTATKGGCLVSVASNS